jgi:hypothetical protein
VRISADRALYLSRVLHGKLKSDPRITLQVDEETLRRAIDRQIREAAQELESIEEKVRSDIEKRKGPGLRDFDLLFARGLEDELRKHGA